MSTLYIRLPSKAAADNAGHWLALVCPFALAAHGGAIEREGAAPLSDLSDAAAKAQRVVLLLAASDVTILRMRVPPLSSARLKAALPNLVEDQLIGDPSDCVVVAGVLSDGLRTAAVVQRAWLSLLARTFISFGARRITALPAQLCLPYQAGIVASAISGQSPDIGLTLRLSEQDGIGLALGSVLSVAEEPVPSQTEGVDQHETAAHDVILALRAVVHKEPIALYVPQSAVLVYQDAVNSVSDGRINVFADNWPRWIAGAHSTTLDLLAGLGAGAGAEPAWLAWRWPLVLSAAILAINITALNIGWWRMKSEANSLRTSMIQIYKSVYPKEPVIIDSIAQMRQKIAIAKRDSGLAAPDDFMAITAALGEAWASVAPATGKPAIASLEYREHSLFVKLKHDGETQMQQMKTALATHNLLLDLAPSQSAVWRIRSAK